MILCQGGPKVPVAISKPSSPGSPCLPLVSVHLSLLRLIIQRPDANFEGLLTLLDVTSSLVIREVYPLIAGLGLGMLFHAPFAALTNGMSSHDRSRATSAFFLVRFIGATSGLVSVMAILIG